MYRIRFPRPRRSGDQRLPVAFSQAPSSAKATRCRTRPCVRRGARGAPMFAYVRAARTPIQERGAITHLIW